MPYLFVSLVLALAAVFTALACYDGIRNQAYMKSPWVIATEVALTVLASAMAALLWRFNIGLGMLLGSLAALVLFNLNYYCNNAPRPVLTTATRTK